MLSVGIFFCRLEFFVGFAFFFVSSGVFWLQSLTEEKNSQFFYPLGLFCRSGFFLFVGFVFFRLGFFLSAGIFFVGWYFLCRLGFFLSVGNFFCGWDFFVGWDFF